MSIGIFLLPFAKIPMGKHRVFENHQKCLIWIANFSNIWVFALKVAKIVTGNLAHGRYTFGRYTFGCHILDISSSSSYTFGDFTFGMLHLLDVSPSGYFTFGMFHLWAVTTSASYTFRCFTFGKLHLRTFYLRTSSEIVEGVILQSCNVPKG